MATANVDLMKLLSSNATMAKHSTGQVILKEGDLGSDMYFILQGSVEIYRHYGKPEQLKMGTLTAGDFFGEATMFLNRPRKSTIVAATDPLVVAAVNSNSAFLFLESQPQVTYMMLKTLCQRLEEANDQKAERLMAAAGIAPRPAAAPAAAAPTAAAKPAAPTAAAAPAAAQVGASEGLFPEGHKQYTLAIPTSPDDMIYEKKFECPLCNKPFTTMGARETKLKVLSRGNDFRNDHENIDMIHYEMVTCPHCYFSNFDTGFKTAIASRYYNNMNKISEYKNQLKLPFSKERQINEVFAGYYLALKGAELFFANPHLLVAKAWLRLSWLYNDCGDNEMLAYANEKAHKAYIAVFENTEVSPDAAQQICLIIGALSLRIDDIATAKTYYTKARMHRSGGSVLLKMAEDGIEEIRAREAK